MAPAPRATAVRARIIAPPIASQLRLEGKAAGVPAACRANALASHRRALVVAMNHPQGYQIPGLKYAEPAVRTICDLQTGVRVRRVAPPNAVLIPGKDGNVLISRSGQVTKEAGKALGRITVSGRASLPTRRSPIVRSGL